MKIALLSFCSLLNFHTRAQSDPIELLIDSMVSILHIKEIRLDKHTPDAIEKIQWEKSQYFDTLGKTIEISFQVSEDHVFRDTRRYDSLGRLTLLRQFDEKDTTRCKEESRWTLKDSLHTIRENYSGNILVSYEESQVLVNTKDTLWVVTDEFVINPQKHTRSAYRLRALGDSLRITEYIEYDDSLRLKDLKCDYALTRETDTGYVFLEGKYLPAEDMWSGVYNQESWMDYYRNPDRYIQMALDGKIKFEYDAYDAPYTFLIYNTQHQLIQDGGIFKEKTFAYNPEGQLTKITHWGTREVDESYHQSVEIGYSLCDYDEKGLPVKISRFGVDGHLQFELLYSYVFW
jgi:hypothetical protein